ncbi:hypothetical protein RJ641_017913 [Dillenia turbinata]|uniref:Uncharacterized protein n=1 Tax=Dillenia turbinata TaxID=194707 RepID=A0AAN8YY31_9MAGN
MESSLLLRCVHFPTARARVPRALAPAVATKAHPGFAHFASQISRKSITFSPITCALNLNGLPMLPTSFSRSDNKIDHKNKTSRVLLGASLVLACVIGIFNCSCRINPCLAREIKPDLGSYSGHDALGALLEYFPSHKQEETQITRKEIAAKARKEATENVKKGHGSDAENSLKKEHEKLLKSHGSEDDTVYELALARAEVLITLGSYLEALDLLEDYKRSDPRIHLYKAIALTMLAQNDKAKKCWTEFSGSIREAVAGVVVPPTALTASTRSRLPPRRD